MALMEYHEALGFCTPGSGEYGYCISCRIHEPTIPLRGSEDDALCPACAHRLIPRFPELAERLQRYEPRPIEDNDLDIPF